MENSNASFIRSMVRSVYALQKLRIQIGNRITMNYKTKLGLKTDGMSEKELEKEEQKILDSIRKSYARITDGIVAESEDGIEVIFGGKFPTAKKFKADGLITTYTELVLVDQYVTVLREEEASLKKIERVLTGIPIYDEWLSQVDGVGAKMSAVIISEIDIAKANYPSSLHAYAGLDTVIVGKYTNSEGKEKIIRAEEIDAWIDDHPDSDVMLAEGKYPVTFEARGRSRKEWSLVKREYVTKEGTTSLRDSITFNPFLKTKLIGVLAPSFLRAGKVIVDGKRLGADKRVQYAIDMGFDPKSVKAKELKEAADEFLKANCDVVVEYSKYGKIYYDYKFRLQNSPHHVEKSDLHRHNMALRYMIKIFLNDFYNVARKLAGLPVAPTYAEAKLGLQHGVMTDEKSNFYRRQRLMSLQQSQAAA